jgi:hypothetical protein
MKQNCIFAKFAFALVIAFLVSACGEGAAIISTVTPAPSSTPEATKTAPEATKTATPQPTSTPRPTATDVPPTPIPALKGEAVTNGTIEVTVLDVFRHDRIVPGGTFYYTPKPGYIVINLFVKIKNLGTATVSIPWSDVYIIEGDKAQYPSWAGWQAVSNNEKVAPLSINYDYMKGADLIVFEHTAYLQAIYLIGDKPEQTIIFRIRDTPPIQLTIKK